MTGGQSPNDWRPGLNALPGRFKCGPGQVQMLPGLNQMLALGLLIMASATSVCLSSLTSKSGCSGSLVHIRHCPHSACPPARISLTRLPIPIDLFATLLRLLMPVLLRRGLIPTHKLTLEEIGVGLVCRQLQDLEDDVGMTLTKACCTWISGPSKVRGNNNQPGKVGNQVLASWQATHSPPSPIYPVTNEAAQHGPPIRGSTAGTAAASTSSTCGCGATGGGRSARPSDGPSLMIHVQVSQRT